MQILAVSSEPSARDARLADAFARADHAKAKYESSPSGIDAGKARLAEVVALLSAPRDDATARERLLAAVAAAKGNGTMARPDLAELVATFKMADAVRSTKQASRTEILSAIAAAARDLQAEFPDQPQGFESLLNVARESDDEAMRALLKEMDLLPAPAHLKADAVRLTTRLDLGGKGLPTVLAGIADFPTSSPERSVIIYGWSMSDEPGAMFIHSLSSQFDAEFVGVNLDWDGQAARRFAEVHNLPGVQIYDVRGSNGIVAWRLGLTATSALLVDKAGVIREPRLEQNAEAKLNRNR